jgi:CHAT domain-containing protein/Flp pilus assembly protein TadD
MTNWCLRYLVVLLVISQIGRVGLADDKPKKKPQAPSKLQPIFSDDFKKNSLDQYQVKGELNWKAGKLELSPGASISRSFEVGSRFEITAWLEFPELQQDDEESHTMMLIDLVGASDCFVEWRQKRTDGKTTAKVSILDIVPKDGKSSIKIVRTVHVLERLKSGSWFVEYSHGVVHVRQQKKTVLAGFIDNGTAVGGGVRWFQWRSNGSLSQLHVKGTKRPVPLSESDEQEVSDAKKLGSKFNELYRRGKFMEALPVGESILVIRKKVLGSQHPSYARSVNNLALLYHMQGAYVKAELLYQEARAIYKGVLGIKHPEYATSLCNLAELYRLQGNYKKAEPLHHEAIGIRKQVLGTNHPDYAASLNNLAGLYQSKWHHAKAITLFKEVRDIFKRTLGTEYRNYATSVDNLAYSYDSQGDYTKAETLYLEARDIRKRVLRPDHPGYARSLNNLAGLYYSQGHYAKTEPLYRQARDIYKRAFGTEHAKYALSIDNLAGLYYSQGDYAKAEPLYLEAWAIRKRVLGVEHPDFATSLNNLAALHKAQKDYAKAELLYRIACDTRKRVLGDAHPKYAASLNNLAALYKLQGEYAKAERLFLIALEIRKRVLGKEHPSYAASLNNVGALCQAQGNYAKAEPLYREALDIQNRVLGKTHPDYAVSLNNLGIMAVLQGDYEKAEPLLWESLALSHRLIERYAVGQSQTAQLKYAATIRSRLDSVISHGLESPSTKRSMYDEILAWKGMSLIRQRQYRLVREDATTRPNLEALIQVTRQLSTLLRQPPNPKAHDVWKKRIAELTEERDTLESQLAAASEQFRSGDDRLQTDELLKLLPEDTMLVDFLSFRFLQRVPKDDYHVLKSSRHFLASILRKGKPVEFVNLGPAADINDAVDKWRTVFLSKKYEDAAKVESAGRKLRQLVWEPLLPHLKDARTVVVCPDRALARVAFAALPGRKLGTYLIEDHRLAYLPVPQLLPDLFRELTEGQRPKGDALLVGDVDYEADSQQSSTEPAKKKRRSRGTEELFGDVEFTPLKETAGEIAGIRDLFFKLYDSEPDAVRTLRQQHATEAAFRQYAGQYKTLHIATHGFFADPSKKSATQYAEEANLKNRGGLFGQNERSLAHIRGFHPGMLSGLALAGANRDPEADKDDGILTADEISFLPLEGVDLVVLSACETGLGAVAGGEGLLGVQRAFQVSGARSVVASLWNVDDVATRRLMERFYRNLWDKKMSKLDALREAQLWMLKDPKASSGIDRGIVRKRDAKVVDADPKKQRTSPKLWAAFVLSGDWR